MIAIKKILVPTDLSDLSVAAIGYACSLAKDHAAEVVVSHVVANAELKKHFSAGYLSQGLASSAEVSTTISAQPSVEHIFQLKRQILINFIEQKIGTEIVKNVKIRPFVSLGNVVDETVAIAKQEQCDLIVMTSQASGFRRLFRGSLTERIARQAPCPVLSIQPSAEVRTDKDERVPVKYTDKWAA